MHDRPRARSRLNATLAYAATIAVALLCVVFVAKLGAGLFASAPFQANASAAHTQAIESFGAHSLLQVLMTLAVVILAARLFSVCVRYLGQPPVVGEVLAGIALGPSLLGRIAPGASSFIAPAEALQHVSMIAQVAVVLYMFLVGLELDERAFRRHTRASIAVSHASMVAPFTLGTSLALLLYPRFSSPNVPFLAFALFIGVSMSVTAFPVLTRILSDLRLQSTQLGSMAVASAAVGDVTAWCLLAVVVALVRAQPEQALMTVGLSLVYVALMLSLVRPLILSFARRCESTGLSQNAFAVICVALLCSALAAESAGIHALFGAFLLGALVPHDSRLSTALREKLGDLVLVLFLPAFFAVTGLRTQISLLQGTGDWLCCALVVAAASVGKLGGSAVAARVTGMSWRDSTALGALMNTRGLMELIVLNLALDLGIISPKLFAIFVLMALATTIATTPLLRLIYRRPRQPAPGEHAADRVSRRLAPGELASG